MASVKKTAAWLNPQNFESAPSLLHKVLFTYLKVETRLSLEKPELANQFSSLLWLIMSLL